MGIKLAREVKALERLIVYLSLLENKYTWMNQRIALRVIEDLINPHDLSTPLKCQRIWIAQQSLTSFETFFELLMNLWYRLDFNPFFKNETIFEHLFNISF